MSIQLLTELLSRGKTRVTNQYRKREQREDAGRGQRTEATKHKSKKTRKKRERRRNEKKEYAKRDAIHMVATR